MIKGVQSDEAKVVFIQFKNKLERDLNSVNYRDRIFKEYTLPEGFNELCFIDLQNVKSEDIINHGIIQDSVESKVKKNIFIIGDDNFESIYVESLAVSGYPFYSCTQADKGNIEIEIIGQGNQKPSIKIPAYEKYCENAEDGGLCNGLDVIFYVGYQAECCSKYDQCCGV